MRNRNYRNDLLDDLRNDPEYAAGYLSAAKAHSKEAFLVALRDVTEARMGMKKAAKAAKVNRENLYRALSQKAIQVWKHSMPFCAFWESNSNLLQGDLFPQRAGLCRWGSLLKAKFSARLEVYPIHMHPLIRAQFTFLQEYPHRTPREAWTLEISI